MTDVKWIKITTDIFDDEKIRIIESMPNGDAILVIWLKLLILAGRSNRDGFLEMSNGKPYTNEMFSVIFSRKKSKISSAIQIFLDYELLEIVDKKLRIKNWDKYQNVDGMEKVRKQSAERQARYRARLKEQQNNANGNKKSDVTVTQRKTRQVTLSNEAEVEVEVDIDNVTSSRVSVGSKCYGFNSNVMLTDDEYQRLLDRFNNTEVLINKVSAIIARSPKDVGKHFALCEKVGREDGYEKGEL